MKTWEGICAIPIGGRATKPRKIGYTMVLDIGMGTRATADMAELAGEYIDNVQFSFGTSALYDQDKTQEKIAILKQAGIGVTPGGAFLQVAIWQRTYDRFLKRARVLGFTTIEVFDGTLHMDLKARERTIKAALDAGFEVVSEVLPKTPADDSPISLMHREIEQDLRSGAFKVIVPVQEGGVDQILAGGVDADDLIWETPATDAERHIVHLILRFGVNVNLILREPSQIITLEALRCGLKGVPMARAYEANPQWQ